MDVPSLSIITPCLNARATLPATLASVHGQDYSNLEHIVVDGGSTDGTLELLEQAPGIRFISEPDRGLSDAVNKGIRMAQGELIGWLNADDVYRRDALMAVGKAFAEHRDAEWGFGRCGIIGEDGEDIRGPVTSYKDFLLRRHSFALHLTQNYVSSAATFVRRHAFDEIGVLNEDYKYAMDYELWLRLGRRYEPLFIDRELAAFRMVEGTLSMSGFERQLAEAEQCARTYGNGHRLPVAANAVMGRLITATYKAMRRARERGVGAAA